MTTTQKNREFVVTCSLGADVLLFHRMRGSEAMSELSEYQLDVLSERSDLQIDKLLGTVLTVALDTPRGGQRFFNGFITGFSLAGRHGRLAAYRATVRPWLWFLTRASDCRIFQDRSVVEIIKDVFSAYPIADFDASALSGTYAPQPYCVQYRESDFNFVSRLMEREGIYYYFISRAGRHTMVLADSDGAHQAAPDYASLQFQAATAGSMDLSEFVHEWHTDWEIQSGSWSIKSFDFEKPLTSSSGALLVNAAVQRGHDQASHAVFDYPGGFNQRGAGETQARARIEACQARYQQFNGRTSARGIAPGSLLALAGHPRNDQNATYLIRSAQYEMYDAEYESAGGPAGNAASSPPMACQFTALGKSTAFRPELLARKPIVQGPQTAMVVGKAGEEIWTDKYGRIKVKFHWDHGDQENEKSSCWIRVAQGWAGKRWGTLFTPRVGQEVIVSFLEGDPDQPLVTGSVYNAENMPPYALGENATRSTIKSNSSKGGGGFNELRFEDKKGSEQIFQHAEKDQDERVKNDAMRWIGRDQHLMVGRNLHQQVGGALHSAVKGDRNEKIDGTASLNVGKDLHQKVGKNFGVDAAADVHIKAGKNIVIEAGASITLKAGGGFIVIGPSSVAVSGSPILLNSGGKAGSGAGAATADPVAPNIADDGSK